MCMLLAEATHFNFRVNLMSCIVAALSRKSWDKVRGSLLDISGGFARSVDCVAPAAITSSFRYRPDHPLHQTSDLCLDTVISVFRADNTGEPSLEIVRLLNRMIKERKYNVHPEVLSCLLHLRLKSELGVRASETKAESAVAKGKKFSNGRAAARRAKGKAVEQPHLSKKAKKALKERKEIEHEMHEAAAEVDGEERATRVSGPRLPFSPVSVHPSERLGRRDGIFPPPALTRH